MAKKIPSVGYFLFVYRYIEVSQKRLYKYRIQPYSIEFYLFMNTRS